MLVTLKSGVLVLVLVFVETVAAAEATPGLGLVWEGEG